jgi:hypothetical protein
VQSTTTGSRASHPDPYRPASDDPRLRAVIEWERRTRRQRPAVRDEVREAAYDKAVDALLKDDNLGRDARNRPSAAVTVGLAERCLTWKRAEDLRTRFTLDGRPRPVPRAAQSLDAPVASGDNAGAALGSSVPAAEPPVDVVVHWRMQLEEVRRHAAGGDLTQDVVTTYLVGGSCEDVAARQGVGANAVHQAKSRFVARNAELGR